MRIQWNNLDQTKSYALLRQTDNLVDLKDDLTADRIHSWSIPAGGGLDYYYGASMVSETDLDRLQTLADEQQLIKKYKAVLNGEIINKGENRRVLHHLTRGELGEKVMDDGVNLRDFYREQHQRIRNFVDKVHSGIITGSTGKKFDTAVQIGIGGSDLGPRALYLALKQFHTPKMRAFFVSNVDPGDAADVIPLINPETTLFILVSKSGATQETLANKNLLIERMRGLGIPGYKASSHLIAVTSKTSPLAGSPNVLDAFYIDDSIGGRFSSTSAVGDVILSLTLSSQVFEQLLEGAHEADQRALSPEIRHNATLMDAMIAVFNRNIVNLPTTAVLPYSQALSRFPAHLQQLDMESNGKSVNRQGDALSYPTGPVLFGECGTNSQHSFYQLLHQGSDIVALQFIGFRQSQGDEDIQFGGSSSQTKLNANLAAQIVAFAKGRENTDPNKNFDGSRPSTLLVGDRLDAKTMGALLAHYENKVMFQGFCWNINSFDQEGVQLGKILTNELLEGSSQDASLTAYAAILGVK